MLIRLISRYFSNCYLIIFTIFFTHNSLAQKVTIDLHLNVPKNLTFLAESANMLSEDVALASNNEVEIEVYGAGDLVPATEILESVSTGAVAAGWSFLGQWGGQIPVANIAATPFGVGPSTLAAWLYEDGGLDIIQKGFDDFNIKVLACHITNPEPGGWFNKEINTVDDIKGLKMRMSGIGAKVLNELGASAQFMPSGEIFLALERGRIDATEYSLPIIDKQLGFNKIAKYYYYPGWHQPSSLDIMMINKDVWNDLSESHKSIIDLACQKSLLWTLNFAPTAQTPAIEEFEENGTEVKIFPDEVLNELRKATEKVLNEEAEKNELYKEALTSITEFAKKSDRWSDLQTISDDNAE